MKYCVVSQTTCRESKVANIGKIDIRLCDHSRLKAYSKATDTSLQDKTESQLKYIQFAVLLVVGKLIYNIFQITVN